MQGDGKIGHIHVIEGGADNCNCGGYGCLEQAASATGIARLARKLLEADPARPSSLREVKNLSAKSVLDAARAGVLWPWVSGDLLPVSGLGHGRDHHGGGSGGLSDRGGVSRAGTFLTEKIQNTRPVIAHGHKRRQRFSLATLGNDAGIYGAAEAGIGIK